MILTENQIQNIEKWIIALRSGKYKQGKNYLLHNDTYCCLGVKCAIDNIPKEQYYNVVILPFLELDSGLSGLEAEQLTDLNDGHASYFNNNEGQQWSFNQIADFLEFYLEVVRIEDEVETDIAVGEAVKTLEVI